MKTPSLFETPKTHPTRRERIEAFKKQHGIETCTAGPSWGRKNHPWSACLMPAARRFGYGVTQDSDMVDCVMKVGRLLEESGVLVDGETEIGAIRTLCEENKIPCAL